MKINPLYYTLLGGVTISPSLAIGQKKQMADNDRPNIVLILAEDLGPRFGCYGDKVANTPYIDALAKEGVRFTNVYTMAGVSAASRAGLITGVFQNFTGLQHMRTTGFKEKPYMGVPPAEVKAYPEILRKNGYFTYADTKFDYQFCEGPTTPGPFSIWSATGSAREFKDQLLQPVWRDLNQGGKPFFINYNPQITHESGLFLLDSVPKGMRPFVQGKYKIRAQYKYTPTDPTKVLLDPYWKDTPQTRKELALFYDNIQVMDIQVGNIIENLKKDGLWENTIFIVSTDHGDCLPRHKREGYESGIHVPFIIRVPEKYKPTWIGEAGSTNDRKVSFEDLAPTILGFAGIETPSYMKGVDLSQDKPEKREYAYAMRGRMDEVEALRSYFVLGKDFQYVRNLDPTPNGITIAYRNFVETNKDLNAAHLAGKLTPEQESWFEEKPSEELYDLKKDPFQLYNIAINPKYKKVLDEYRGKLDEWRNAGNDMTLVPESVMVKDLLDENGQQRTTLPPVAVQDEINKKIYISNRTENASIGYSFDGKHWEIYNGSFMPPANTSQLLIKAVRYGWKESETITLSFN